MKQSNWPTTSRQSRGYGKEWQKARAFVLERDGHLCQCRHCKAEGRTTLATEVHHVKPKAECAAIGWTQVQTDDPSNLASMSHDCHVRADAEAQGNEIKPRVRIGLDGFPE